MRSYFREVFPLFEPVSPIVVRLSASPEIRVGGAVALL